MTELASSASLRLCLKRVRTRAPMRPRTGVGGIAPVSC